MNQPSMLSYIKDQGNALKNTYAIRTLFCDPFLEVFKNNEIKKVYFLGSGTSYHASLAAKYYFEKYLNVEAEASIPTFFTNYVNINNNGIYKPEQILVIGISQSGTSVSTIEAIKKSKSYGYKTIAITDALDSLITLEAEKVVKLTCGKELIPVETRGYSVTVFEMYLLAIEISKELHYITKEKYEKLNSEIDDFLEDYENMMDQIENWYQSNKEELLGYTKGCVAGYGVNTCTAYEAMLKMFETFKKPVNCYDIEEMIHGPQMAFDNDTYVFIVAGDGIEFSRLPLFYKWFDENEVTEHLFIISTKDTKHSYKDCLIKGRVNEDLSPLVYTIPFQIMSARNCIEVGIDTSVRPARRKAFAHIYKEDK